MNGQQLLSAAVIRAHELLAPELADHAYGDLENFATAVAAALPKVRYAVGEGPLDLAWRQSQAAPVIIADPGRGRRYRAFLSFAFRLQQARGEDAIFLPGRKVGALLGVSHVVVQAWIALAVGDGYLEVVDGTHRPGRARRFRFIGRV